MREIPIYIVVIPTGRTLDDKSEEVIILDVKLTRASADAVAARYDGKAKVKKLIADKEVFI